MPASRRAPRSRVEGLAQAAKAAYKSEMASGKKALPSFKSDKPIVLVGMMGVGKTTIGRRLAPRLGLPFFDADEEIEKAAGMSVSDLFAAHGEASFRRGEAQVIERLINSEPIVLATGGGALTNAETRALVADKALSIWLKADIDVIMERVSRRPTRPLLQNDDPRATIERLMAEREAFYAAANIAIESRADAHAATVNAILEALSEHSDSLSSDAE